MHVDIHAHLSHGRAIHGVDMVIAWLMRKLMWCKALLLRRVLMMVRLEWIEVVELVLELLRELRLHVMKGSLMTSMQNSFRGG